MPVVRPAKLTLVASDNTMASLPALPMNELMPRVTCAPLRVTLLAPELNSSVSMLTIVSGLRS